MKHQKNKENSELGRTYSLHMFDCQAFAIVEATVNTFKNVKFLVTVVGSCHAKSRSLNSAKCLLF